MIFSLFATSGRFTAGQKVQHKNLCMKLCQMAIRISLSLLWCNITLLPSRLFYSWTICCAIEGWAKVKFLFELNGCCLYLSLRNNNNKPDCSRSFQIKKLARAFFHSKFELRRRETDEIWRAKGSLHLTSIM